MYRTSVIGLYGASHANNSNTGCGCDNTRGGILAVRCCLNYDHAGNCLKFPCGRIIGVNAGDDTGSPL